VKQDFAKEYVRLSLLGVNNINQLTECTRVLPQRTAGFSPPDNEQITKWLNGGFGQYGQKFGQLLEDGQRATNDSLAQNGIDPKAGGTDVTVPGVPTQPQQSGVPQQPGQSGIPQQPGQSGVPQLPNQSGAPSQNLFGQPSSIAFPSASRVGQSPPPTIQPAQPTQSVGRGNGGRTSTVRGGNTRPGNQNRVGFPAPAPTWSAAWL
jgi:hypothetical protein